MKKFILKLGLLIGMLSLPLLAQQNYNFNVGGLSWTSGSSVPASCPIDGSWFWLNTGSKSWYVCNNGAFAAVGGSGSGTVSPNNVAANAFATYAAAGGSTTVGPDANFTDQAGVLTGPSYSATGAGAALTQVEIADPGAPAAGSGSLYFNSSFHRAMIYNNGVGPKAVSTWGVTSAGGLQVGGAVAINGLFTESLLAGNTVGTGVLTESSTGVPSWIALSNASGTQIGTTSGALTNNALTKFNSTGDIVASQTTDNGTTVTFPAGTGANPGINFVGNNTNTGFFESAANTVNYSASGNNVISFGLNGLEVANTRALLISSTNAGNGAVALGISAIGSGTTETMVFGNGTVGDESEMTRSGGDCRISSDVTLSTSATNICNFANLPNVSKVWSYHCDILWAVTAGTTPTIAFGVNASQTPAGTTNVFAEIKTTNTNTATEGSAALSASGAVSVLTSPTLTTSATLFQASLSGTLNASATAGSFAITSTGTGVSFAGAVKAGSYCWMR